MRVGLSVSVPQELAEQIAKTAKKLNLPYSVIVRAAVEQFLKSQPPERLLKAKARSKAQSPASHSRDCK